MLSEDQSLHLETNLFIEDTFYKSIARATVYLSSIKKDINLSWTNNSITNHTNIKLPTIELPCFDGNYENWHALEDYFLAFVAKNDSLSDVEKLCYLCSELEDPVWDLIKPLDTTSENYKIALNLVKKRFNHYRKIVYSHINALLAIKFINPKTFINSVDQHVRSLQALNIPIQNSNALLVPLFVSKLDQRLTREWETKMASLSIRYVAYI